MVKLYRERKCGLICRQGAHEALAWLCNEA